MTTRRARCAATLLDRLEPAELEPGEPDPPGRAHDPEAEVAEEVGREHRPVHPEALVRRLALEVAVGEGLDRAGAAVAGLADRGEEERLQHPGRRRVDEVGAGDEHRVVGGRARRQLVGVREERRRAVLDHAERPPVVAVVDGAEGAELLLDPRPSSVPCRPRARAARLPPDAGVADRRRRLERLSPVRPVSLEPVIDLLDDDVDGGRPRVGHPLEVVGDAALDGRADRRDRDAAREARGAARSPRPSTRIPLRTPSTTPATPSTSRAASAA